MHMQKTPLLLLLYLCLLFGCTPSEDIQPLTDLTKRLLPEHTSSFIFKIQASETDFFELSQHTNSKIQIIGNNPVSLARGLNHYLRNVCHKSVSWCGSNISNLPYILPTLKTDIRVEASVPYRYYLNYCTYSYSMAYWDWKRWEKEIDWMALQGINMPLMAVNSQYIVWRNTLLRLGFDRKEIMNFLPGAGYEAWWLMGNLEGFGGSVSDEFIEQQVELQLNVLKRVREYGMTPVFQGFYGMVPSILKEKFPTARIIDQDDCFGYQRPAFLDPNDPLFDYIAQIYYEEQNKLFGEAKFFAGDPFYEGGISTDIDTNRAGKKIVQAMRRLSPDARWILQGWQNNPTPEFMDGLHNDDAIILDLMACERPQWNNESSQQGKFQQHTWIWCALPNFGGKTSFHGKLSNYASGIVSAKHNHKGSNISGIGTAPEGVGTIPIVYDLIYDMAWRNDSIDVDQWIENYAHYRYGNANKKISKAWKILSSTIYECNDNHGGPIESYICARPADLIESVSTWGNSALFYEPKDLLQVWSLFYSPKKHFIGIDSYEYDLVDLTRQVLSDYAKILHSKMNHAFNSKNKEEFRYYSHRFLNLIKDKDELLSTRREFMLGTWLAKAENKGCTEVEKQLFITNAKRQITTWSDIDTELHDYANKEWSGLIIDLYYPRWEAYVTYKANLLYGKQIQQPDYQQMEQEWIHKKSTYPTSPNSEGSIAVVEKIYNNYYDEINQTYLNNKSKL